jgi:hypothetical protein
MKTEKNAQTFMPRVGLEPRIAVFERAKAVHALFFYYYYYLVSEAIGTAATPGLLCQTGVIVKMIVEKQMECILAGETEILGENLPQRNFCPSQTPT